MTPIPNGRDGRGRFALGNAGGPGNPNARTALKWRERLASIVTDDDFDAIVRRMVADAIVGDEDARNHLLDRPCGKVGLLRENDNNDEHRLLFIRSLMVATPPLGSMPAATGDTTGR